jgi:hypothetical protein
MLLVTKSFAVAHKSLTIDSLLCLFLNHGWLES